MKPRFFFWILSLVTILVLAACASAETNTSVTVSTNTPTATINLPAPALIVLTPTVQAIATSRGPNLEATDPSSVKLASGNLQLVEFFRFT